MPNHPLVPFHHCSACIWLCFYTSYHCQSFNTNNFSFSVLAFTLLFLKDPSLIPLFLICMFLSATRTKTQQPLSLIHQVVWLTSITEEQNFFSNKISKLHCLATDSIPFPVYQWIAVHKLISILILKWAPDHHISLKTSLSISVALCISPLSILIVSLNLLIDYSNAHVAHFLELFERPLM